MELINIFSKGWNFSQDGPGNRLLYHFQGCNMHCPWCSNPEGISVTGSMLVNTDKLLDSVCPYGAISHKVVNRTQCRTCIGRECVGKNRNEGIRFSAKAYSIEELSAEIDNASKLFHSGGGVTITGGEPTLQFDPLKQLLTKIKEKGIHTAIETNGTSERLPELLELLDILIIDMKHPDPVIHRQVVGVDNEKVIRNLETASGQGIDMWIRIPLIPGFNDGTETMIRFMDIIKKINREGITVELLPYHEYGKIKWEQIGKAYTMPDKKITTDELRTYKEIFISNNIQFIKT